ncbi:MAG: ABC transporter permease [Candidatus Marinimicrobia bacterium]|nr:ABC transporter permease [Candidatus Neomarinimicrobiota bacterium]|tara:strand:+ start:64 stop:1233 length:1170 start_codon:yes stop_codon:yes gene_type:complete
MLFNIAIKNLVGAGIRTWLNVFVTSVSIFMIIFSSGMYTGMKQHAMNVSIDTEIAGGAFWHPNYDPYDPITFEDSHSITPSILTELVESNKALEVLVSQASIYPDGRVVPVIMKGITLEQEILNIPTKEILKYEGDNIPILIGRGMSKYTKLNIGDTFIIRWMDDNRTYDAGLGEIVFIMDSDNFKIDFGHIWLPIEKMQKMLSMENESTYVVFDDNINPHSAGDWIKRDVKYLIRDMETIIEQDRPNAIMIYIILLSLAAMGIFNAQTLSIFRRKKEIGTLMALGMHKRKVVLLFTIEGAMNAIFAIILTVLLFGPLLYYFSIYGVPLPIDYSDMGLIIAKRLIPIYSMPLLVATALIVFLILLLVSYLPSRKISKMHPVDAIRGKTT